MTETTMPADEVCVEAAQYDVVRYRNRLWLVLPHVAVVEFGNRWGDIPLRDLVEQLFDGNEPLRAFALPSFRPRDTCADLYGFDWSTGQPFEAEMTTTWVRFYLRPALTVSDQRDELLGQSLQAMGLVERMRTLAAVERGEGEG